MDMLKLLQSQVGKSGDSVDAAVRPISWTNRNLKYAGSWIHPDDAQQLEKSLREAHESIKIAIDFGVTPRVRDLLCRVHIHLRDDIFRTTAQDEGQPGKGVSHAK